MRHPTSKAPIKTELVIDGPAGPLEALLETPGDARTDAFAVVCHPHPQYQGTMHNKVVHTLARAFNDVGIPALRFNFRGVGQSAGEYAGGTGEIDDVLAVCHYARGTQPDADISLAGFSFGAVVSARAAERADAARLISIAPAVNVLGRELREVPTMPWLIVQGDADDIVPCDAVKSWHAGLTPAPELIILPGVGHFFHGHLVDLRTLLAEKLS